MDTNTLLSMGFDEKAARIYLAALSVGTASVQTLAQKADLKRPTAYVHIQQLLKEGLLEKVPLGKKEYYYPVNPELLATRAQQQLQAVQMAMPELRAMQNIEQGRPGVRVLVGRKGLEQIYDEIGQANSIRFWTNLATFERIFHDTFTQLSESIAERQIRTKEIIADTPEARRSSKRYALTAGKHYSSRLATKEGIQNDSAIYNDVMALFRIHENNLFVVRIEDASIVGTMKVLFDMAWQSAKPFVN
mgnify:CR=1 FL=1